MNQLHPVHLFEARAAILDRFRILNTAPEGTVNVHVFENEYARFTNGYFKAALLQLDEDKRVEILMSGRFVRLLTAGYEEAHAM